MKRLVVLSGAGMSAESGINTFRDADGLWEGHDVMDVASPEGWHANSQLVLDFYNQRRRQLIQVKPNLGHQVLKQLEQQFDVTIITQNVDDLHERAGSSTVIHLHGELLKAQSTRDSNLVYPWVKDIKWGDCCELGGQLRPFIVWFGEQVPMLDCAIELVSQADIVIIIGTSMQVYPAASLAGFASKDCSIYYLDPKPAVNDAVAQLSNLTIIKQTAVKGLPVLTKKLSDNFKDN
ncbi:SIR2 family NAD-dependent protein deacylase [Thalassotalea atypica]|uniref:SIR2 family NAD-dependent protein deacylase n=1 Tax=Thalassotalea atypica TaxID=2054316 RepID=UPI002572723D|nr:NAD-dependent deacylase [Thalassotalea atypica]